MGERYGMLPSEILSKSSTLDLYIMDTAISYHNHKQKAQENKASLEYDQSDLTAAMERTRKHREALKNGK
jgi:hypothetical protein